MGKSVTFLHVADVHLGAPVRGLRSLTDEWADRLAHSIPESFDRVVDTALSRAVDFVVLAGDAFDTTRASYAEHLHFFDALGRLDAAGIPVYLVAGNHDPYTTWANDIDRLPPSARMLGVDGPECALFTREGEALCAIIGRSYYNQTWPSDQRIADGITGALAVGAWPMPGEPAAGAWPMPGSPAAGARPMPGGPAAGPAPDHRPPFVVGVIHTGLDIDAGKAPADVDELLAADVDYWACGHLHKRLVRPSQDDPRIVFPGCIQGRDIKESGERGCYLVKLEENLPPQLEFVPTSSVILETVTVNVGMCRTLSDVVRTVAASLFRENGKAHCDEMVARVLLEGQTDLHRYLVKPEVIADLRKQVNDAYPSFFCDALVDRTHATEPLGRHGKPQEAAGSSVAAILEDPLFGSVLAGIADEQRVHEEALVNYVQSEFVKRGISVPDALSRRVGTFNEAAETLVTDLLREDEGGE